MPHTVRYPQAHCEQPFLIRSPSPCPRLALALKSTWSSIKRTSSSWDNLNRKAACDGYGVRYRAERSRPRLLQGLEGLTYDSPMKDCGTVGGNTVRPCLKCRRAVYNECRIHTMYCADFRFNPAQPGDARQGAPSSAPRYSFGHTFLDPAFWLIASRKLIDVSHPSHDEGNLVFKTLNLRSYSDLSAEVLLLPQCRVQVSRTRLQSR